MSHDSMADAVSSRTRLRIADLLSTRPRTLGELAEVSGISVQGVLKHLAKLERAGLAEGRKVAGSGVSVRKVYSSKGVRVSDFSVGDLRAVKMTRRPVIPGKSKEPLADLEVLAEEAMLQRRRIRDQVRKLGRMIDELVEDKAKMDGILESMDLGDDERLVLQTLFAEESLQEGERALTKHFGLKDSRRSIEKALAKARRSDKK